MPTIHQEGADHEVYDTYDNVDLYLSVAVHASNWRAVSAGDRKRAMVGYTRVLNRQSWRGVPTTPGQALAWPRTGLTDRDGNEIDDATIPQAVLDGFAEGVELLLGDAKLQAKSGTATNIRRVKAGPAEVEFFDDRRRGTKLPTAVHELVGIFLAGAGGLGITATGTAEESAFTKDYGLTDRGLP